MTRRCTYGPVPSRRLGLSLGVDLMPYKVCCYDCLYCQVGRTTELTVARRDLQDPAAVAAEVEEALRGGAAPECITLSGSGEPTLHAGLAEVVRALRRVTALPLVLLTNGGLLWQPEVLEAARLFDVVAPTLTAADAGTFRRLNRPHPQIDFERMLGGLRALAASFTGKLRLEVMLVRGVNDSEPALQALAALTASLGSAEVDLNTVVRPPAYPAPPLALEELEAARAIFERAGCRASLVATPPRREAGAVAPPALIRQRVLETVSRRPCTLEDLVTALGIARESLAPALAKGLESGELALEQRQSGLYYRARQP